MCISKRLSLVLKEKDMTRADLARTLGKSQGNIASIIKGEVKPGAEFLLLLYKKLNVNINWLLSGEGEMFLKEGTRLKKEINEVLREHGLIDN